MSKTLIEFIEPYKAIFCDAYGVLTDASGTYPFARESLKTLRDSGKQIFLLTNDAASPLLELEKKWDGMLNSSEIISSARVFAHEIRNESPTNVVVFGEDRSLSVLQHLSSSRVRTIDSWRLDPSPVDLFAILGCRGVDWHTALNASLKLLQQNPNCKVYAPNPDRLYSIDSSNQGIAIGSLAFLLENATQSKFAWLGKPYKEIYNFALKQAQLHKPDLKPSECLMIGDTLETDILGAEQAGWDSLLVLSGLSNASHLRNTQRYTKLKGFISKLESSELIHPIEA